MAISLRKNNQTVSLAILLITVFLSFTVSYQGAYAATQTITATGTWRDITPAEHSAFNPYHDSQNDLLANPAQSGSNPENANGSSPGWHPDGTGHTYPNTNDRMSIILDLPVIDLSCSSSVQINVVSGQANLLPSSTGALNTFEYGWQVVNNVNEPVVLNNNPVVFINTLANPGDTGSLIDTKNLNPDSIAFGLKLVLTAETSSGNQWEFSDVAVELSYDDDSGSCNPIPVSQSSRCGNEYLNIAGVDSTTTDQATLGAAMGGFTMLGADGIPADITRPTGTDFNLTLDDAYVPSSSLFRLVEVTFTPQASLLNAGIAQLTVSYDFNSNPVGAATFIFIADIDNLTTPWNSFKYNANDNNVGGTLTAFIPSVDLPRARIFFAVQTSGDDGTIQEQIHQNFSNVDVNITTIREVAVCGVSFINSTTPTTNPSTTAVNLTGVANSALGTLPETGNNGSLVFYALTLVALGILIVLSCTKISFKRSISP